LKNRFNRGITVPIKKRGGNKGRQRKRSEKGEHQGTKELGITVRRRRGYVYLLIEKKEGRPKNHREGEKELGGRKERWRSEHIRNQRTQWEASKSKYLKKGRQAKKKGRENSLASSTDRKQQGV